MIARDGTARLGTLPSGLEPFTHVGERAYVSVNCGRHWAIVSHLSFPRKRKSSFCLSGSRRKKRDPGFRRGDEKGAVLQDQTSPN